MEYQFNEGNFEKEVLESEVPVLVDFFAEWCGPCKMMGPVIAKLAEEFDGKMKIGKCNVDDNMDLAEQYRVSSIPNMQIFKNGQVVDQIIGAQSESALRDRLTAAL
ncbi:MAG: thioredoxin [Lachnospiraceae bacterium]|nr:thioredoxin [Lachnospiraceae bacterium]